MEGSKPGIQCQVCRRNFKVGEVIKADLVEEPLAQMIREKHPEWSSEGYICLADLNLFRTRYVTEILKTSSQEIYDLGKGMAKVEEEQVTSRNINKEFDGSLTLGRAARRPVWPSSGEAGLSSVFSWPCW